MVKYSDVRKSLKGAKGKEFIEGADSLTHFWQNNGTTSAMCYRQVAEEVVNNAEDSGISLDYKLPFVFDVPFAPVQNPDFTFIDLFAGIGGFRIAFHKQNGKCVFSSEWNKYAQKTYEANFGEVPFGDITKIEVDNIPDHDILLGGFPCQPFSIAGVSKKNALGRAHGFLDKTQGTLFFDIARIIEAKRPKAFLLENVKNLRSHDKGRTFEVIFETLKNLGYYVESGIIDAASFVPQHRERIYIVGFNKELFGEKPDFNFPEPPQDKPKLSDILDPDPDPKYTLTGKLWNYLQDYSIKHKMKGNGFGFGLIDPDGITRTLSARYYKDGSEILIPQSDSEIPRRLTPEECKRLMGFPEEFIIDGIDVSDTQLYRQFGNAVVVPVVEVVANEIVKTFHKHQMIVK
jgi:DNA (cytosine-5)-methyltransferase 1